MIDIPLGAIVADSQAVPIPRWDELSDADKLERLRTECIRLHHSNLDLERVLDALLNHRHSASGDLLAPMKDGVWAYRSYELKPMPFWLEKSNDADGLKSPQ